MRQRGPSQLSIGEVAKRAGLAASALRYYEREGLIPVAPQRGGRRVYAASIDDGAWRIWRDSPGFSQRFVGTFADEGDTVAGVWQLCTDDKTWQDDLKITYRRCR